MWMRRRGKEQSKERGEKRRDEREHLSRRRRLNYKQKLNKKH